MKLVSAEFVEYRGFELKHPKKQGGADYLLVYVEESTGKQKPFVCRDLNIINSGFVKGDMVRLLLEVDDYKNLNLLTMSKKVEQGA